MIDRQTETYEYIHHRSLSSSCIEYTPKPHIDLSEHTHKSGLLPREHDSAGPGGAQAQGKSVSVVIWSRQESEENAKWLNHQWSWELEPRPRRFLPKLSGRLFLAAWPMRFCPVSPRSTTHCSISDYPASRLYVRLLICQAGPCPWGLLLLTLSLPGTFFLKTWLSGCSIIFKDIFPVS